MVALAFSAAILGTPLLVLSGPGQQIAADPAAPPLATRPAPGGTLAGTSLARFQGDVVPAAPTGSVTGPTASVTAPNGPKAPNGPNGPNGSKASKASNGSSALAPIFAVATTAPQPTTTTTAPRPTTTTEPPTTTTAPPPPRTETGEATWYSESPAGGCASPTLDRGTVVEVVDNATGARISCLVDDREADNPGRVLDLSYSGFSALADPSQGVIDVTISW